MQKPKILIVDDKAENLIVLEELLSELEVDIVRAHSGNEALAKTLEFDFAIAIIDVQMPGMDGFETVELLRKNEKTENLPVIFVSAIYKEQYHQIKGIEVGAVDFITKPIIPVVLLGKIRVFLNLYEQRIKLSNMLTERDCALDNTEKAKDRIDAILKSLADGLIVTDTRNNVILMNQAAEDLLDIRFSEVIGQSVDFMIREKTLRDKVMYTLKKKTMGYQFDFELVGDDPSHVRIMRAKTSVILNQNNQDVGIVIIFRDVTFEKEVDRMKTEFLSTAAHELRTPLTSILGFAEILLTREDLSVKEKKKFLSYILCQSKDLAKIVNDLLDISRIEARQGYSINKEEHDIYEIINKVIPFFKVQSKKHRFDVDIQEKTEKLLFDKEKIDQVLKNLLDNAVKYSPKGGLIKIRGGAVDGFYKISIEDQGIGMTQEHIDKVFDKFFRANASDSAPTGTGLGMTIVKYIVEGHGGHITIESKLWNGTKVTFSIPKEAETRSKNKL